MTREPVRSCCYGETCHALMLAHCLTVYVCCVSVCDYSTGRVGGPLVCSEIKLQDWVEGESNTPTHIHNHMTYITWCCAFCPNIYFLWIPPYSLGRFFPSFSAQQMKTNPSNKWPQLWFDSFTAEQLSLFGCSCLCMAANTVWSQHLHLTWQLFRNLVWKDDAFPFLLNVFHVFVHQIVLYFITP